MAHLELLRLLMVVDAFLTEGVFLRTEVGTFAIRRWNQMLKFGFFDEYRELSSNHVKEMAKKLWSYQLMRSLSGRWKADSV